MREGAPVRGTEKSVGNASSQNLAKIEKVIPGPPEIQRTGVKPDYAQGKAKNRHQIRGLRPE